MGGAILLAGLGLLAAVESRRIPLLGPALAAGVVLAAVAVGAATASNNGVVQWQQWSVARAGAIPSMAFVWDAQYAGLSWPSRPTVMLDVRSRERPAYVRAAVLDDFTGDRWVTGPLRPADYLEPAEAFKSSRETKAVVTIHSLFDSRLVGGSVPVRFAADTAIVESAPGFASLPAGLYPGLRYSVWSYSPSLTSAALSRAPAVYPQELLDGGMLDVGSGVRVQPFGTPGRYADLLRALERPGSTLSYVPLARAAERVTRGATSPYAAVLDLERWFLLSGGFRYSDHPRVVTPALVGFVTRTRSGYCQYFAGAMALMLRDLGIPARVAVGFAGPTYDRASGTWVVTDEEAHAWVEVWFHGYGWLPFDPTPALPGSTRSPLVSGVPHRGAHGGTTQTPRGLPHAPSARVAHQEGGNGLPGTGTRRVTTPSSTPSRAGRGFLYALLFVLLLVAAAVAGIAVTKAGARFRGRLERDPRCVAAACRKELAGFLLDQGITAAGSATLRELGELAHRRLGVEPQAFVAAATAARFGRVEHAPTAARDTRRELGELLESCRRVLTRRERLRGLVSLRSLARAGLTVDLTLPAGSGSA